MQQVIENRVSALLGEYGSAESALDAIGRHMGDEYALKIALGYFADFTPETNALFDAIFAQLEKKLPAVHFANRLPRAFGETRTDCTESPTDYVLGGYVVNVADFYALDFELVRLAETNGKNAATVRVWCEDGLYIEITKHRTEYEVRYFQGRAEAKLRRAFSIAAFERAPMRCIEY